MINGGGIKTDLNRELNYIDRVSRIKKVKQARLDIDIDIYILSSALILTYYYLGSAVAQW